MNTVTIPTYLRPRPKYPDMATANSVCPACHGTGDQVTQYGRRTCHQCWGYGWVKEEDKNCIHNFEVKDMGHFMHEWTCSLCGRVRLVDSSG